MTVKTAMFVRLPAHDGMVDLGILGNPDRIIKEAVGVFVRGATGRVCLVDYYDNANVEGGYKLNTLPEVEEWAESVVGGYLDY